MHKSTLYQKEIMRIKRNKVRTVVADNVYVISSLLELWYKEFIYSEGANEQYEEEMSEVVTQQEESLSVEEVDIEKSEENADEDTRAAVLLLMDRHGWSYRSVSDMLRLFHLHPNLSKFKTVDDILQQSALPKITSCKVCPECHNVIDEEACEEGW